VKKTTKLIAGAAVLTAATATWVPTMSAQAATGGSDVRVGNAETVQVYMDPSGKIGTKRVYEQLDLVGKGHVSLRNPVSTDHLRNLDGFAGLDVKDGTQVVDTDVDGRTALRSVSDYDGALPLRVTTQYKLDGKTVQPGDVVGATGHLEVRYTVENITGRPQQLSYDDGHGGRVTKTLNVPIPMVATLETTAPANFDGVRSGSANMGGDGHGGTQLNFTMTLFPPIGSTTATVGYSADIHDGVVPRAELTALPVNPLESPVFKSAAGSYQGGVDSGVQLTEGASKIDTNLLRLRDGAAKLLAGLIKLDDGAAQLRDGLAGQAAPGAAKLADGAGQLDTGLGKLADGASRVHDGSGAALTGSEKLRDGLGQISGGLGQLADAKTGLPAATSGITKLKDGVDKLLAGLGDRSDPQTLIGGLNALHSGLTTARFGSTLLATGAAKLVDPQTGLPAAKSGVDLVRSGLQAAGPKADQLLGALNAIQDTPGCSSDPTCKGTVAAVIPQVQQTKSDLGLAAAGLGQVSDGLRTAITGIQGQLVPGLNGLADGLVQAEQGSAKLTTGAEQVDDGLVQVRGGLSQLGVGVAKAVAGVMQLDSGADQAYTGSSTLATGLGQLNDGTGQLADGARSAKDGSGQLADGAKQLSDGIGTAADGSRQLADGLDQARDGAPQLVNGAQKLSDKGTKKLVAAGESTSQDYGQMVAVLDAGAKRAQTQSMALGAPSGAAGFTAYDFVITGADGENSRNLARGLAGGALLAAAGGVLFLRRRLV
jgi:putative membrane protein